MTWLTGAAHPIMQPAYQNGKPVRQIHTWSIDFVPRAAPTPTVTK